MPKLSTDESPRPAASAATSLRVAARSTRRVGSERLLAGERELVIEHQGAEYHLRVTRNDKLILTK